MSRIIVSLTTSPARLHNARAVMDAIFEQTVMPEAVMLNLPGLFRNQEAYPMLELDRRLEVHRFSGEDPGPIAKVLPTLDVVAEPDALLITIDDDVLYPPNLVERFLVAAEGDPTAAFGTKGFVYDEAGHILPSRGEMKTCDVLQGYGACAYRRSQLDAAALRAQLAMQPHRFRFSDDVILSNHLAQRGVERMTIELDEPLQHREWGDAPDALKYMEGGTHKRYAELRAWLESQGAWALTAT